MSSLPTSNEIRWELLRRNLEYKVDFAILRHIRDVAVEELGPSSTHSPCSEEEQDAEDAHRGVLRYAQRLVVTNVGEIGQAVPRRSVRAGLQMLNHAPACRLFDFLLELLGAVVAALGRQWGPVYSPELPYSERMKVCSDSVFEVTGPIASDWPSHLVPIAIDLRQPWQAILAPKIQGLLRELRLDREIELRRPGRGPTREMNLDSVKKSDRDAALWKVRIEVYDVTSAAERGEKRRQAEDLYEDMAIANVSANIQHDLRVTRSAITEMYASPLRRYPYQEVRSVDGTLNKQALDVLLAERRTTGR